MTMTKTEVEFEFREHIMPYIKDEYEKDGVPDYIARSEEWNNFTNCLCEEGRITANQYNNWTHPRFCGK